VEDKNNVISIIVMNLINLTNDTLCSNSYVRTEMGCYKRVITLIDHETSEEEN